MKIIPKILMALILTFSTMTALAVDVGTLVKAQSVLGKVSKVVNKYQKVQTLIDAGKIDLQVATPLEGSRGKFLFPLTKEGNLTAWADKALTAHVGAQIGNMAAEEGMKALTSKIPFSGFFGGAAKKKAKTEGAVLAIGGWEFIKENTEISFKQLSALSVYMHSKYYSNPNYEKALAAAMAIYPELEKGHERALKKAYKKAKKRARRL